MLIFTFLLNYFICLIFELNFVKFKDSFLINEKLIKLVDCFLIGNVKSRFL